jgi:hypothetical protein
VAWAGRVSLRVEIGDYESEFRGRLDAIYRKKPNGEFKRLRPDYHPRSEEFRKDVSEPVLVFDRDTTWYFGNQPQMLPDNLMALAPKGRGHRANGASEHDAATMHDWLKQTAQPGIRGTPRDRPLPKVSARKC